MKKNFLTLTMVLLGLLVGVNTMQGQDMKIYFASLKAQQSPASTGSGQVKLTWVDIIGRPMEVDLAKNLNYAAFGGDFSHYASSYGPAETAQMVGGTMSALDGVECAVEMGEQIFMTSNVYFLAEAVPANGSYLSGWTFTDSKVSRIDTAMGGHVTYTSMSGEYTIDVDPVSPCFKVLPDTSNNVIYSETEEGMNAMAMKAYEVANTPSKVNNLYAVFNKYLLSNPTATNGQLEAISGETTTLNVSVDVEGDITQYKENYADFVFPSMPGAVFSEDAYGTWSWNLARLPYAINSNKMRAEVIITYTAKSGITVGKHETTITISMAGTNPSSLTIPLSVNALDPARPEAYIYVDKVEKERGELATLLGHVGNYTNPVLQLNKPCGNQTLSGKTFTLDLNGNTAGNITIESGEVTIAYSKFGGNAGALSVTGGKAILNGGTFASLNIGANGEVVQNGATITGAATNSGILTTTAGTINGGLTSSKTLTLNGGTFRGTNAVTVSGGTANINRGDINGTTLGLKVTNGTVTVKKLAAITSDGSYSAQRTGGKLNVECGKFGKPLNGTIAFTSGFFKDQNYGVSAEGKKEMLISAGVEYNEGYRYFLGDSESAIAAGVPACRIGTVGYAKLEDAIAYANNNPGETNIVIFMTNDYVLPAGFYTLPANATIVVPMSDEQSKEVNISAPRVVYNDVHTEDVYTQPTEFRRLTFASGVNMDVFGKIELTCSQFASNEAYTSQPYGPYGHLVMEEGSHMTLQDGSELRAWGFMTGKGETDARRGAKVREMFQMGDWKGALTSVKLTGMGAAISPSYDDSEYKIFPVTQYFIQNVESPVKYHPGAVLSSSAAVSEGLSAILSVSMVASDIPIVGVDGIDEAIFLMKNEADAENTWVRKWYDAENDVQTYDINNAASIGSMVIDMGVLSMVWGNRYISVPVLLNSAKFDLPLTSNFKIHLLSGKMDFKQNTNLLPGAEVEVDKESVVTVAKDNSDPEHTGALYVYDAADWGKYAYINAAGEGTGTAYTKVVRYAPSWNGSPTKRNEQTCPASAAINVHGTFETATGFVYTSEHGANIFSSNEDAGTFIFNQDATAAGTRTVWQVKGSGSYESRTFYPANLRNGNGTYVNTNTAITGDAYCYINDEWTTMYPDEDDPCFMVKHNVNGDVYYAKPAEYVAIVATKDSEGNITGNTDHTFSDAAGTGRLFILMDGCQWWEVEKKDNLYHCIHPNNDTYYYWADEEIIHPDPLDPDYEETIPAHWEEKTFVITWKNWDGEPVYTTDKDGNPTDQYVVTYGTQAVFLGTNPKREANIDYTYDFTGWSPELGPVTSDVTYTATYEQKDRMYTITFKNEGGTLIETQFLKHNAVPVCENTPTKDGYILQWDPAISPVIGDQIYTATWLEELPTEWDVTFVNNAGGVLKATHKVGVTEHPTYTGTPVKENADHSAYSSNEYTYTFWGWSAVIDGVAQQFAAGAELPCPTAPTTYTAVYTEEAKTYVVRFLDENGVLIPGEEYNLPYGAMPVCSNTPIKENTAEWTYGFAWTPQIQTVMASETPIEYRATFPATKNRYTITLTSNLSGACTFTGAGTFDYGTNVENVAVSYDSEKYTFTGWNDGEKAAAHSSFTLTEDITLAANFTVKNISNLEIGDDGIEILTEPTEVKDLILTSNGVTSGQLIGASYLDIKGEAIFRLQQSFAAQTWYAVAVPWRVDVRTGIYAGNKHLTVGDVADIFIIEFDANAYAAGSANSGYWKYVDKTSGVMTPGKLYMIYLWQAQNAIDFHMKKGTSLITVKTAVSLTGGSGDKANWNAIANPAVYKANLETGAEGEDVQFFNNGGYTPGSTSNMIVGQPVFAQVSVAKNVTATVAAGGSNPVPAYRRAPQAQTNSDTRFIVELTRDNILADRLIVQTAEEKEDTYVIGQDLAKFGVSSKVAQMWMNRYDTKLCKNTVEMTDDRAEYPLTIFAPKAGEYTISNPQSTINNEDYTLYLTYDGEAIWNLNDGAYTMSLSKGNTYNYGLRISARAPQMPTGIDEIIVNSKDAAATKVLYNNQVFIIREGKVYTVTGEKVK